MLYHINCCYKVGHFFRENPQRLSNLDIDNKMIQILGLNINYSKLKDLFGNMTTLLSLIHVTYPNIVEQFSMCGVWYTVDSL